MDTSNFQALDPDIIRKMLDGRESNMEEMNKANEGTRESIRKQMCPYCKAGLQPWLSQDPNKIYDGEGRIQYLSWCPSCRKLIEE